MGLFNWLSQLFLPAGPGHGVAELARRLGLKEEELHAVQPRYHEFPIPKRSGGTRRILSPDPELKQLQRRILRRLLARLHCHPAATGFESGRSIVTNALPHTGQAVIVRMDLKNFFECTSAKRVGAYLRAIGWNREASRLLVRLCTYEGGLPQGAPTSPRLSNLVNYRMDARLSGLAAKLGSRVFRNPRTGERISGVTLPEGFEVAYTRYADDLTFSFSSDQPSLIRALIRAVQTIVLEEGYVLHLHKKLHVRRRHDLQIVTGLVVNPRVNLPRRTRRWLRAVEHHVANGREATLTPMQLDGWRSLQSMIERQRERLT